MHLFNRNQRPIAEAKGRREQAAATFLQTQAQVIENSARTFAVYRAALGAFIRAESSYQLQESQLQIVEHNISAGADDRLTLDAVELQVSALALARCVRRGALGDLEDSMQQPLVPGDMFPKNSESLGIAKLLQNRERICS